MHRPVKYAEKGLAIAAQGVWYAFNTLNSIRRNPSFTPKWSEKPLNKSWQKTKPPLGWPRQTDSLCPTCVREARQEILDGKKDVSILLTEKVGEIKATIIERDGKIVMVKDCPIHGHFEDVMSIDPPMFKHLEESFPGRDIQAHNDEKLHNHGSSTISGTPSAMPIRPILRGVRRSMTAPRIAKSSTRMIMDGSKASKATRTTPAPQPPRHASGVRVRRSTRARAAMIRSGRPMATTLSARRP